MNAAKERRRKRLEREAGRVRFDESGDPYLAYAGQRIPIGGGGVTEESDPVASAALTAHEGEDRTDNVHGLDTEFDAVDTALAARELLANKDTDGTLAANSDTKYASQKAVKTYVDGRLEAADAMVYKGLLNCSANPNYPAASAGHAYKVSAAGKIGGGSGPNVEIGDLLICLVDSTSSGTHASVGANWDILQVNVDGAVTGPAAAVNDNLAGYNGTSGKIIEDSGAKAANVPSDGEKGALVGSSGAPSASNPYVTQADPLLGIEPIALADAIALVGADAHWTLDAVTGAADLIGAHNLTGQNGATAGGGLSLTSDGGASADLDGTNDYFSSTFDPFVSNGKLTVFGAAQHDTATGTDTLWGSSDGTVALAFTADGQLRFTIPGNTYTFQVLPAALIGKRFIYAFTYDDASKTMELFINGMSVLPGAMVVPSATTWSGATNFQVGGANSTNVFDGKHGHAAAFLSILNPSSILWLTTIALGREPLRDWGFVTALPSTSLVIGDRCSYVADLANGIVWALIYDGQGTYPWKKIGGPPLLAEIATSQTTTSTTYAALATAGPSITVPLGGDYDVEIGCRSLHSANNALMSYDIGGTGAVDADAITGAGTSFESGPRKRRKIALAAGTALVSKYKGNGAGTATFAERLMTVDPVRVG